MQSHGTPRRVADGRFLLHAMAVASVLGLCAGVLLGITLWG